ncbi:ketopantoate hydroxymethyltransferase [Aspergillus sclerotioniger CBS 115572]|uniref:3-methyl-2-oxobutanoate hydroxymethyltransferase n=1 Tax=Aspergillus sclerotioniger CBS 115572 TaxID=1450535 RepID=A0A317X443_9EURO|nr:ketopantoate hydroxymethyltransferase [Aspergillus sclerotioniger CBS 115572]PWY93115.1 ketopantoate hydroxymethyltransferase [Aspergillus sclerotioniger CBS 115572]
MPLVLPRSLPSPPRYRPQTFIRWSSHSAPQQPTTHTNTRKKVTIHTPQNLYRRNEPITILTAHDFLSGLVADAAGIEVVLIGDSLSMVALGMKDTTMVTMDEMSLRYRSESRAVKRASLIADLLMGSYEVSPSEAVESTIQMVKQGRVNTIKLEGGAELAPTIKRIVDAGIPGKTAAGAVKVLRDAMAVQEAGAFMILVEAMPAEVAAIVSKRFRVPTIGIGSGNGCSGQVLVQRFVKRFADVWGEFKREVKGGVFPGAEFGYGIGEEERVRFEEVVGGGSSALEDGEPAV